MKMLQGVPVGVVIDYQDATDTWAFTILKSYSYFTDLRKCMTWPLHLFCTPGSCIFRTLEVIIVYAVIMFAQYRIVK